MGFEHKEGSATLFVNDKKGNDKAPDWRGDGLFNGKKVKLAGWKKQGAKGGFISLTIQEDNYKKEEKTDYQSPIEERKQIVAGKSDGWDDGDNIPFAPLKGTMIASY